MRRRPALIALALLAGLASPAEAQTRDLRSDPDAPITVTGTRLTREQARERAVAFVRELGIARGQQATARWVDPICPRVRGISEPYAGMVAARMRAIAQEVGMRVAPENCRSNISVSLVGDAEALMQEIERRSPTRLQEVPSDARDALVNGDAPVRWWYLTGTRSRHDIGSTSQSLQVEGASGSSGGSQSANQPVQTEAISHYDSSVISTQVNRAIVDANVVIDLDRVEGMSLEAIAAYAAFVAFTEVRTGEPQAVGSILGLFSTDRELRSLTEWDMTFLRSLYRLPLDRPARRHRGMLVRDLVNAQTPG